MSRQEDIQFLEKFRGRIQEYLFVGYAPVEDELFPTENWAKMKRALDRPEFRQLRREINEEKARAQQLLMEAGVGTVFVQYPPPAIGGPILRFNLFDLVTENRTYDPISLHTFLDKIDEGIGRLKVIPEAREENSGIIKRKVEISKGFVFIAMPMGASDRSLEDVHDAIKEVSLELQLVAERVDDPVRNERITDGIIDSLTRAEFVVADLTHAKPNVYYEAGYAHALGKLPIYIARAGTKIEFDLKDYPVIFFESMRELKSGLRRRLGGLRSSQQSHEEKGKENRRPTKSLKRMPGGTA